ncbi:MAG: sigma-70 family RNA polymerase sigma factor [Caldilineaceae bacterium]|nr:sigma-70 family RNA polymerase sigma factor [Caldilineaceae bacterium]
MSSRQSAPVYTDDSTSIRDVSEEELLTGAANFDEAALGELYDRYEARIYSYIYRRTGDSTLAEDLTAQVFLKMLEAIRGGKAWHSSFSGWLYRIAHNAVIDFYRQRDRQKQTDLEDAAAVVASDHNPVVIAETNLDAAQLRAAIARLTDEQAEVISLRFLEGYSISEVAVMMDKTEGSIKALQYRAVATLRQLLQREW